MGAVDDPQATLPPRGSSRTIMRVAVCKDCQREAEQLRKQVDKARADGKPTDRLQRELDAIKVEFTYPESQATAKIDRGGPRSDRCPRHRRAHGHHTEGMAVAYVDLETIGEVADRDNPSGPFGGLGPLPDVHAEAPKSADLSSFEFGMNDADIVDILNRLRHKRVVVLKAGTGTGKSTFAPYRLMDPPNAEDLKKVGVAMPEEGIFDLIGLGPIIVTEPRVAAATGVSTFVGTKLSGTGVGPGFPVGYQVSGDRNHDDACRLIYVTDGTMINWLREGRLSKIGTVIVDEAHERSTNIDFIMGYLRRDLAKYPHLRVIITSATFDVRFYEEYFGGPDVVAVKIVEPVKTVGYGMPLFPGLDAPFDDAERTWAADGGWKEAEWPLVTDSQPNPARFVETHWTTQYAPALTENEARPEFVGDTEDLHDTTAKLLPLRFEDPLPVEDWKERMPDVLADFIIRLVDGLDEHDIFGDVLGFLPTGRTIEHACAKIQDVLGDRAVVFALLSKLSEKDKADALSARRKGDKRKVVVSTNLAETSLTVEGVRFVVDSGLIAQSEWNPELAVGGIPTKAHSQAGIRQRWGRVGRKAPGWVFPLYTKQQYAHLDQDTPPGSARENLESLLMTARLGGIDDVKDFPWPAAFEPTTTTLDKSGRAALGTFVKERDRADSALLSGGAVDEQGHPTSFGKEAARLSAFGSTNSALAILYADRLACVPEVATILALLEDVRLIGPKSLLVDDRDWPTEWRLEAARRHRGIASLAEDDAHLALILTTAWERADPTTPPWEPSADRRAWARRWWVGDQILLDAAVKRQEVLGALSPAMKEEVKRFIELPLLDRARGVLGRSLAAIAYRRQADGTYLPAGTGAADEEHRYEVENDLLTNRDHEYVLALRRRDAKNDRRICNLVAAPAGRPDEYQQTGVAEAMRMIVSFAQTAKPQPERQAALGLMAKYPVGTRLRVRRSAEDPLVAEAVIGSTEDPVERPPTQEELEQDSLEGGRRRRRRRFDGDTTATLDDASGELGSSKALGVDDEAEQEAARAALDRAVSDHVPCEACAECLSGRPHNCTDPQAAEVTGRHINDLKRWRLKVDSAADHARPLLRLPAGDVDETTWLEVAGYVPDAQPPEVTLARYSGPEPDEDVDELPEHDELEAGSRIDLVVGEADSTHTSPVRVLYRADGRGHFVLSEAGGKAQREQGATGISLDRHAFGLLERLHTGSRITATVIPTGAKEAKTVTLLEVLHRHLHSAAGRTPAVPMLVSTKTGKQQAWAIGTVLTAPDDFGRVQVELSLRDRARGLVHLASVKADAAAPRAADPGADGAVAPEAEAGTDLLGAGDTVRVRFKPQSQELSVAGIDLIDLADVVHQADRFVYFKSKDTDLKRVRSEAKRKAEAAEATADESGSAKAKAKTDADRPVASTNDVLESGQDPVPLVTARTLAALDDAPSWQRDVWRFWAISHHHQAAEVAKTEAIDDVDHEAAMAGEDQTPLELRRQLYADYVRTHPPGSPLTCTVKNLTSNTAWVTLAENIEARVVGQALGWARPSEELARLSVGDQLEVVLVGLDDEEVRIDCSARAARPDPAELFFDEHPVGSVITAEVKNLHAGQVFVRLADNLDGRVARDQVSWRSDLRTEDLLAPGDQVQAKVLVADRQGRSVSLSLKELQRHPIERFAQRQKVGDIVDGQVARFSKANDAAYIDLGEGCDGRLHVGDIDYDRPADVTDVLSLGDTVTAKITAINADRRLVDLSLTAMQGDRRQQIIDAVGTTREFIGTVKNFAKTLAFINLGGRVEGKIHVSRLAVGYVNHPSDVLSLKQRVRVRPIGVDVRNGRNQIELAYLGPAPASPARRSFSPTPTVEPPPVSSTPEATPPAQPPAPQPPAPRRPSRESLSPPARRRVDPAKAAPRAARAPRSVEAEGATVREATRAAVAKLGLRSAAHADVEVLAEEVTGWLGRLKQPARVRATERL